MKTLAVLLSIAAVHSAVAAEDFGKLIFQDDFQRNESQETVDEPGNGWQTNSKSRAKGHKQVDLKDGTMRISLHPEANHAVSVTHPAEFTDGAVSLRFMLEKAQDSLGLDFADPACKEVHAGHLFAARVYPKAVQLADLKTGSMRLDIHDAREAKQPLSAEQEAAVKGKDQSFPRVTELGKWHELTVKIEGETLSATVDGQAVGSFNSPGIAHQTKRMLRLIVSHNAVVDDLKIWRKK